MGGRGSSRWQGHPKRPLVQDSLVLDCLTLSQAGVLDSSGGWMVEWTLEGEKIASVAVGTLRLPNGRRELLLAYAHKGGEDASPQTITEAFALESVPMGVAGPRWFFRCAGCDGRARKLYMPPHAQHFGCRACGDTAYSSVQTHDARVDRLRREDPQTLRWAHTRLMRVGTHGAICWAWLVMTARCGKRNDLRRSSATVTFHRLEDAKESGDAPTRKAASG